VRQLRHAQPPDDQGMARNPRILLHFTPASAS
jgi:hypothetical protein